MGTRFLLTKDSTVPDAVKQRYLAADLNGTVVTTKVDGMPHRMLRTALVEQVEDSGPLRRLAPTARRTLEFKRMSGIPGASSPSTDGPCARSRSHARRRCPWQRTRR